MMKINQSTLDQAVDKLGTEGFYIWDQFLPDKKVNELRALANEAREHGTFKKAGIGNQALFQINEEVRGDYIHWLDRGNEHGAVQELLDLFEALKSYLNQTCYLGLKDFETHFAIYPKNTFYKKHIDRFQKNGHRIISFVLYLNTGWIEGDGGELALYAGEETHIVRPLAGRLLLFKSELPHEVLLAHKERYSITGWMLDKDMSLTFLP